MAPSFPAEIFELIVQEVGRNHDLRFRIQTLASIALASWALRHIAHAYMFSDINILGTHQRSATLRIRRLDQLISADPNSDVTGIASYIRSFTIRMVGIPRMVRPTLDDGKLANILRKIYKTQDVGPRTFSLTLGILGNLRNQVFDWTSLNADFQSAFYELCRRPSLTTLELGLFTNVPRELLRHSVVKNIKFFDIRLVEIPPDPDADLKDPLEEPIIPKVVDEVLQLDALEKGEGILLQAIDTDHSIPILDILDMTPEKIISPKLIFSKLQRLTSTISNAADFSQTINILADSTLSLESLGLRLCWPVDGELEDPKIEYGHLSTLKTLSVDQSHKASYKSPGSSTLPQICNVIHLLKLPSSLATIEISIFLYSELSERTPNDIFDGHDFSPLDELFSHSRFYALRNLTIKFMFSYRLYNGEVWDEQSFRDESAAYARNKFPEINTVIASGAPLDFDINVVPLVRQK